MITTIEIKRGLFADLPATGNLGEPFFCTDTGQLFIWNGTAMAQIGTASFASFGNGTYLELASDTFKRANETPVNTAVWSGGDGAPPGDEASCQIINNELCPTTANDFDNVATYTAITWPNNQWAQVQVDDLNNFDGNQNSAIILAGRTTSNTEGYGVTHYNYEVDGPLGASCNVSVYAHLNSAVQQIFFEGTTPLYSGDFIRLELNGNTLAAYVIHNGAIMILVPPTVCQSNSIIASGNIGLQLYENIGGSPSDAQVSNFSGGFIVTQNTSGLTFDQLGSGTNTTASMVIGSGASIQPTGSGVVNATEINGVPITGTLTHAGQIPISQPGNESAVWADPLVQGLFAPGTNVTTGNSGGAINPVLVGAQNPSGLLENINVDSSGRVFVTNSGTFAVQDSTAEGYLSTLAGTVTGGVVAVSATSLPLPSNAAKETGGNLATIAGAISSGISQDNNSQWGGAVLTAATNTSTAGTDVAPISRVITRKFGQILTTTPLAANATYTSAWFDTNQTGDMYVSLSWQANVISANNIAIQQTDDSANASIPIQNVITSTAAASGSIAGIITRRYWRVNYPNGGTLQTSFEAVVTASSDPPVLQGFTTAGVPYLSTGVAATDLMTCTGIPITSSGNIFSSGVLPVGSYAMTGDSVTSLGGPNFAAVRTPSTFVNVAAVSITAGTPVSIWTPTSGKKFRLMGYSLSLSVAGSILFEDGTGTEVLRTPLMAAGIGQISPPMGNGLISTTANNHLFFDTTASGTVSGYVFGTME